MNTNLGVLNSDALNRDGYYVTLEALNQGAYDSALMGLPSLIGHDFHRPQGWVYPFAIHIQPGLSRLLGRYHWADSSDEMEQVKRGVERHLISYYSSKCKPHLEVFKKLLGGLVSENGYFYYNNCVAYVKDNIAIEAFPTLFSLRDKDGLVYLSDLLAQFNYKGCGVFVSKKNDYALFCHQYFRRSLSKINNVNTYFIDNFLALANNDNITLRIALDVNMIGLSSTYSQSAELDYCYGPYFTDNIDSIPTGVSRYISNESQKFFSGVSATDFWWKNDMSEKVLEAEEVREAASYGVSSEHFGNRYIHSIYSSDDQVFRHFDGAIRLYDEEMILQRWETDIKKAGKQSNYTKLFRIDGGLSLADWKRLIIFYFNGNSLIYEYFGVKDEYDALLPVTPATSKLEEIIPYSISQAEGLRLFVSYDTINDGHFGDERRLTNLDHISHAGESFDILEHPVVELVSLMQNSDMQIEIPDAKIVNVEDKYSYFPTIEHGSSNTQQALEGTLKIFREYFGSGKFQEGVSSLSLSWRESDKSVTFSLFGQNSELRKWFADHHSFPVTQNGFHDFIISQKEWLDVHYQVGKADRISIVRPDGIQFLKRSIIDPEWMEVRELEKGIGYRPLIPSEEKELHNLVLQQKIYATPMLIDSSADQIRIKNPLPQYQWELLAFVWTDNL